MISIQCRPAQALLVVMVLVSGAEESVAQSCLAIPSDTPGLGSPSNVPFGNNNVTDPVFSDTRYQVLVAASLMGNQPRQICDLQIATSGSRLREFEELTVTLGHNSSGQLASQMTQNLSGPSQVVSVSRWRLPTTANTWTPLGLAFDFMYDPAIGDLVVEFRVRGGGAASGVGSAGLRTSQSLPYVWTQGGGYSGNAFSGGGIKLRLCSDTNNLLALGGGCVGSNGAAPELSYSGSAMLGGAGFEVHLNQGPANSSSPVALVWSFGLRTLPIDLGLIGATGCNTHCFGDLSQLLFANGGSVSQQLVPPNAPLVCLPIWNQWFVFDPGANPLGVTTSNLGRVIVGT
jgi:hypothetical protein